MPAPKRPVPDDFAKMVKVKTGMGLRLHYKAHSTTVRNWCKKTGLSPLERPLDAPPPPPMPDDFAEVAVAMPMKRIAVHYKCTWETAARWMREMGFGIKPTPTAPNNAADRKLWNPPLVPARDDTAAGEAADFLRAKGWRPVCRLRTIKPQAPLDTWVMGRMHLSTAELIQKALSKGWQHSASAARSA